MNKIQVQLPGPLYDRLKQLACHLDYSMAELLRKGAEQILVNYSHVDRSPGSAPLPRSRDLGLKVTDPAVLRRIAHDRS